MKSLALPSVASLRRAEDCSSLQPMGPLWGIERKRP